MQALHSLIIASLQGFASEKGLPAEALGALSFWIEPPKDLRHGDLTTNAPLACAKALGCTPRELGAFLVDCLSKAPEVEGAELAGPGFVNARFSTSYWHGVLRNLLKEGDAYGETSLGKGEVFNVEYVSANPTGPLHAGHGRVAVIADILANLLEKVGYRVVREYYINDTGNQAKILAHSTYLRYQEALGRSIPEIPEGYYPGEYLKDVAAALVQRDGDRWLDKPEAAWLDPVRNFAVDYLMTEIKEDLKKIGISQEVFSSEHALHTSGALEDACALLEKKGLVYEGTLEAPQGKLEEDWEPTSLLLFRSTLFGDDRDRPLKKSDGTWTYFAGDIAYHLDKIKRGAQHLVNVWGADHGSHVKRMTSAVEALTEGQTKLQVMLCQTVNFFDQGLPVKMSKRAGTFVTLRDIESKIGKDVLRFMMVTRRPETHFDFDFAKAVEQSKDNPVFYVQYAHARACSVLRMAQELFPQMALDPAALAQASLAGLEDESELNLIKRLADWPRQLEAAALAQEPHRLAAYLYELAQGFHTLWSKGKQETILRFLISEDEALSRARMALVSGILLVIRSGLRLFGVKPVEEMRA